MLDYDFTTELLDLKDVIEIKHRITDNKIAFKVVLKVKAHECPNCGYVTSLIHDYRIQKIKDIPIHGKQVIIEYKKRRYRCPCCKKRFAEQQSFLPKYHQMTNRLAFHLIELMKEKRAISDIARSNSISNTTVFRLMKLLSFEKPKKLPKVLSIDEFRGNANGYKFQCILTDPVNKTVLDILENRYSNTIIEYFRSFNNRDSVKYFVMDMNKSYLSIAKAYFPKAKVIIDRFHVARYNTWAFENVRKRVQNQLSKTNRIYFKRSRKLLLARMSNLSDKDKDKVNLMLSFSEDLTKGYLLKEKFYEFMDCKDSDSAKQKLNAFFLLAHVQELSEYNACITMLNNWSEFILNSFDHPYSNGYTEGMNNKIKVIKRIAFGYRNFDNFRKRILFAR